MPTQSETAQEAAGGTTADQGGATPSSKKENPSVKVRPWSKPILEYVRLVAWFIEGCPLSRKEAEELLAQIMRQHSMARCREIDHLVAKLHQNPPEDEIS